MKWLYLFWIFSVAYAAIVGIDFGHQFTKAIMAAPGIPFEIVFTDEGKRKDASVLSLKPVMKGKKVIDTERVYGSQVGSLCTRFPEACASNLKRLLGKSVEDDAVSEYVNHHFGVTLVADEARNGSILLRLGSGNNVADFPVEELSAMMLNHVKDRVLKTLDSNPDAQSKAEDVVISIEPFASQLSRLVLLDTLQLADYSSVLGLVDEGTAVAIAFALNHKLEDEEFDGKTVHYVVYDVGAGSTTATLFSYTPYQNQTVHMDIESVGYDESFGGEFLTTQVYQLIFEKFLKEFNLDASIVLPPKLASRLAETAEKAKTILSANTEYKVSLESFYEDKDFKTIITREEYENSVSSLLERCSKPILDALKNCPSGPKTVSDIKAVILNGGASRTPFIQKQLVSLLGSENKIAKVVNTDEACAMGTAIQAYNLKTSSKLSPLVVNEKLIKDFGVSIGSSEKPATVFSKGSLSGNSTLVSLGPLEDNIQLSLHEDGKPFVYYNLTGLLQKSQSMKCKPEKRELFGTFTIDKSKIFTLSRLSVQCPSDEDIVVDQGNDINSTISKISNSIYVPVPAKQFIGLRPLNRTEKQKITRELNELKFRDLEKIKLQETKNLLESACYELRNSIDEHRDILSNQVKQEMLDELRVLASEVVEWLEFDADDAEIELIHEKFKTISEHKGEVDKVIKMHNADLSQNTLQTLAKEANNVASQVQDYLLEYGKQINMIREKYNEESIDFDKENEKAMKAIFGKDSADKFQLDSLFSTFKTALKNLTNMVELSAKKYNALDKKTLFETSELIRSLLKEMLNEIGSLQKNHEKRVSYLLNQYDKIKARRAQKELKKKLKEEMNSTEEESEAKDEYAYDSNTESPTIESEHTKSATVTSSHSNETNSATSGEDADDSDDSLDHDEL